MDTTWVSTTSQEFTTVTPDTFSGAFSINPMARDDDFGEDLIEGTSAGTTPYISQTTTFSVGTLTGTTQAGTSMETTMSVSGTTGTGTSGTGTTGTGTTGTGTTATSTVGSTEAAATDSSTVTFAASSASSFIISSTFEESTESTSKATSETTSGTTTKESKADFTSTTSSTAPETVKIIPRDDVKFDDKLILSEATLSGTDSELETTSYSSESTTEPAAVSTTTTDAETGPTTAFETTSFETTQTTDTLVDALSGDNIEPIIAPKPAGDDNEKVPETPPTSPNTETSHSIKDEKVTVVNEKATVKPDVYPIDEELSVVTATKPLYVCTTGASVDDVECEENRVIAKDKAPEFLEVNRKCKFFRPKSVLWNLFANHFSWLGFMEKH